VADTEDKTTESFLINGKFQSEAPPEEGDEAALRFVLEKINALSSQPPLHSQTAYTPFRTTHVVFGVKGVILEGKSVPEALRRICGGPAPSALSGRSLCVEGSRFPQPESRQTNASWCGAEMPEIVRYEVPTVESRMTVRLCFEPVLQRKSPRASGSRPTMTELLWLTIPSTTCRSKPIVTSRSSMPGHARRRRCGRHPGRRRARHAGRRRRTSRTRKRVPSRTSPRRSPRPASTASPPTSCN
jgi:hypothetical protein